MRPNSSQHNRLFVTSLTPNLWNNLAAEGGCLKIFKSSQFYLHSTFNTQVNSMCQANWQKLNGLQSSCSCKTGWFEICSLSTLMLKLVSESKTQEMQQSCLFLRYKKHCTIANSVEVFTSIPQYIDQWTICSSLSFSLTFELLYEQQQTCSPQLAPSTMAMQNASVRDVLRKMWPCTRTPRTSLCSSAPSRRTLQSPNSRKWGTRNTLTAKFHFSCQTVVSSWTFTTPVTQQLTVFPHTSQLRHCLYMQWICNAKQCSQLPVHEKWLLQY